MLGVRIRHAGKQLAVVAALAAMAVTFAMSAGAQSNTQGGATTHAKAETNKSAASTAKATKAKKAKDKGAKANNAAPKKAVALLRGILVPKREVLLTSLSADSVETVKAIEGERVKAGQMLVSFSCDDANAGFSIAKARLKQYKLLHEANSELLDEDAVTMLDFALSQAKVEEGEGELAFAKAQVKKCALNAPYDAVVVNVAVKDFANVQVGEPLVSLVDDKRYELIINVPSPWVQWRDAYQNKTFSVRIDETQKRYQAVVKRIGSLIDATSRTVELVAEIVGDHNELAPGMTGNTDLAPPAGSASSQQ